MSSTIILIMWRFLTLLTKMLLRDREVELGVRSALSTI